MQTSHSRIEAYNQCPRKYQFRYLDKLRTIPDDAADNPLYLGTALHTGIETGSVEQAITQYYSNYPIITDDHVNQAIALEAMITKAQALVPEGKHEVRITDRDFTGFIDLLVPVERNGMLQTFDLYDFKYSNNKQNYLESDQLHLYKYFFEKNNPLHSIRNMYFLIVPKSKCKQIKGEDLQSYRNRLLLDVAHLTPELVPVPYDPTKVIRFLLETKALLEAKEYPMHTGFLCKYCDYYEYCQKGIDYVILPENKRRTHEATTKKVVWVYGSPFSGKTTFANAFPDPLMLNTDGNIKFVDAPYIPIKDDVHKEGRMTVRKSAWDTFKEVIDELELKQNGFRTIVVDLLEDVYEFCRRSVCDSRGWSHESDDSFKAYDIVRGEFLNTLKRLMALDYDNIILISHLDTSKDITKKGGDKITAIKPNINEKIANKVAGMVDIVARTIADDGSYTLNFKRNEVIFGGGRLQFKQNEIPLDYQAFCDLYNEANGTASDSFTQKVHCEDTKDSETHTEGEQKPTRRRMADVAADQEESEPVNDAPEEAPVNDKPDPDEQKQEETPVRRRKRRTED